MLLVDQEKMCLRFHREKIKEGGRMDRSCLAILGPFQWYFSHIRTKLDDNERLCAMESL